MGKRYRRSSTVESPACARSAARRGPTPFRNCSGVASASVVIPAVRSDQNCTELPAILQAGDFRDGLRLHGIGRVDDLFLERDRLVEGDPYHVMQYAILAERGDYRSRD